MDFRILGPLEVHDEGRALSLGGRQQRALLSLLLLRANEVVPVEQIVDELWPEAPPPSATKSVHALVSRLRRLLEHRPAGDNGDEGDNGVLLTRAHGYLLRVAPGELDLHRFESLLNQGREALAAGRPDDAAGTLRDALAVWRGPALTEFAHDSFAVVEIARLNELRLSALEERVEADLASGRSAEFVAELEALVAAHPLRERLRGQLMLALYRSGRQADALGQYQETRRLLVDELGLEPSRELQRLERAILAQEPSLDGRAIATLVELRSRGGRRHPALTTVRSFPAGRVLVAAGAVALVVVVAATLRAVSRDEADPAVRVPADSLGVVDLDSNEVVRTVPVGVRPGAVAVGEDGIWVANLDDNTVSHVAAGTDRVVRTIGGDASPAGLAVGFGSVWVANDDASSLSRIDPRFDRISRTIAFTGRESRGAAAVGAGLGGVWVAHRGGTVSGVDPERNTVVTSTLVGNDPSALAVGAGAVWVTNGADGTLSRIDRSGAVVATIPTGRGPAAVAVGEGSVWVANGLDDTLAQIDPTTSGVLRTIPVGRRPTAIAIADGGVWVANSGEGTISRVDPAAGVVVATLPVGGSPAGLAAGRDELFVTAQRAPSPLPAGTGREGGGTLRIVLEKPFDSTDPAHAYTPLSWQLLYATCAKLLNNPGRPAPAGSRLVPEVAESLPRVSDGGRTYTFRIRQGFGFSPPSAETVSAQTFKEAIERSLSPKLGKRLGAFFLDDVVGATAYIEGRAAGISGIVARGNTLTIRLTKPSFDLSNRLAMPFFCAVPLVTPVDEAGVRELPSAGPYYVASETPGRQIVLARNPRYGGARPQRLERIVYTIGIERNRGIAAVEAGRADYAAGGVPARSRARLDDRYGPRSPAAARGRQSYFSSPTLVTSFLALNTRRGLFADVRLRRAVAFAVDRAALRELYCSGCGIGEPTDQLLPPGMPGFVDAQIYPLDTPDLDTARRLAAGRGGRVVLYTCNVSPCPEQAATLRANLAPIGIDVEIRQFPLEALVARLQNPNEPWDVLPSGWAADYAEPYNFLDNLLSSANRGADGPNVSGFSDATVDRRLRLAAALTGVERYRAYARLDRDVTREAAPLVPLAIVTADDFFAARVGCQVYQPVYGMDLAALCLRR